MKKFKSVSTIKCAECESDSLEFCYMETVELVKIKNDSTLEIADLKNTKS